MTAAIHHAGSEAPIIIPRWTWMVLIGSQLVAYLMLQENGLLINQWETLHEFFHDGRHALGFPCH